MMNALGLTQDDPRLKQKSPRERTDDAKRESISDFERELMTRYRKIQKDKPSPVKKAERKEVTRHRSKRRSMDRKKSKGKSLSNSRVPKELVIGETNFDLASAVHRELGPIAISQIDLSSLKGPTRTISPAP
jgi:hypothetical protein